MNSSNQAVQVLGEISLREVFIPERPHFVILIIGPTGSGKSSFIETLQGPFQDLQLSKDQLEGCTQKVTCYQVINVECDGAPLYLIDTPGFADSKISENEIIKMIRETGITIDRVFYFTPINETRLPGTKRKTIQMFATVVVAKFKRSRCYTFITFVTTMWDTLHNERTKDRGEAHFAELRDQHFKALIHEGAEIARFEGTQESALSILRDAGFRIRLLWKDDTWPLYRDLLERIQCSLQEKQTLESELLHPLSQTDPELNSILKERLRTNEATLTKFVSQFVVIKDPPVKYRDTATHLRLRIPESIMTTAMGIAVYRALIEEIQGCLRTLKFYEHDLRHPGAETDLEWTAGEKESVEAMLIKLVAQFVDFEDPPRQYGDAAAELQLNTSGKH